MAVLPASASPQRHDHRVQAAAILHLATRLLPADSSFSGPKCIAVFSHDLNRPPATAGDDPPPHLLSSVRARLPDARPLSACNVSRTVEISTAAAPAAAPPVALDVGPVRWSDAGTTITIAYWVHGGGGGGWICDAASANGDWRLSDCLPLWIS